MSMVAVFKCAQCKVEIEFGRFAGSEVYVPETHCDVCERRVKLLFLRYVYRHEPLTETLEQFRERERKKGVREVYQQSGKSTEYRRLGK